MILSKSVGSISVQQALDMLVKSASSSDAVQFKGDWYSVKEFARIMNGMNKLRDSACTVSLYFYGGPPGNDGFFNGSLRTYLLDQLFRLEAEHDEFDLLIDFVNEQLPDSAKPLRQKAIEFYD